MGRAITRPPVIAGCDSGPQPRQHKTLCGFFISPTVVVADMSACNFPPPPPKKTKLSAGSRESCKLCSP
jgi:hypothetical protein